MIVHGVQHSFNYSLLLWSRLWLVSMSCRYIPRPCTVFKYWNKWLRLVFGWWRYCIHMVKHKMEFKFKKSILGFNEFWPHRVVKTNTQTDCDWLWFHIEIVLMSFSHTSLVCTQWPHFKAQAKTNHPSTCSVTRKMSGQEITLQR